MTSYWGNWGVAERWESPKRLRPTLARHLAEPWVKSFIRRADSWIAYGSRAKKEVIRLGADPERTVIAPNAVPDLAATSPRQARYDRPMRFLFVGQLVKRKGVDILLDAFGKLGSGELWIAGDGPLRQFVEQAAARDPRIRCLGYQRASQRNQLYEQADVLVLPARYEVWGLVVNEAMYHGLPLLLTEQVGAGEDLVEEGVNGLIVRAGSVAALVHGMRRLADWPEEGVAAGARRSKEILSDWTIERAASEVVRACGLAVEHRSRYRWP